MSFQVEIVQDAQSALEEAQSGGNGKFPPLLKGEYQANVVPLKKDGDRVEVADFGGTGPNGKKKVLRVAVRIVDGSPLGAKKQFFIRVPLFMRYAPTEKHPKGAPARMYFDFWSAMGVPEADILAGHIPDPNVWMGKPLGIVLSDAIEPDKYNALGSNEVSFVNKAGNAAASPRRAPGQPLAPWLDGNDNIIVGYQFQSPEAQALYANGGAAPAGFASGGYVDGTSFPGQVVPQTSFGQQPATSFGQQPAAATSFGQQPPAGQNVVAGPWAGQQTGLQQAAAAGGTSF